MAVNDTRIHGPEYMCGSICGGVYVWKYMCGSICVGAYVGEYIKGVQPKLQQHKAYTCNTISI